LRKEAQNKKMGETEFTPLNRRKTKGMTEEGKVVLPPKTLLLPLGKLQ